MAIGTIASARPDKTPRSYSHATNTRQHVKHPSRELMSRWVPRAQESLDTREWNQLVTRCRLGGPSAELRSFRMGRLAHSLSSRMGRPPPRPGPVPGP